MLTDWPPGGTDTARRPARRSRRPSIELPCRTHDDPDLWFAESPADLERAKLLCAQCAIRVACLASALEQHEPWGVWGGEIFINGAIVARKRPRGRPRKDEHSGVAA